MDAGITESMYILYQACLLTSFNINMQRRTTLSIVNFKCCGNHNEDRYDVKLLRCYINESFELKLFLSYSVADAFSSLIMWRGQVKVGSLCLPLHSACFFVVFILNSIPPVTEVIFGESYKETKQFKGP